MLVANKVIKLMNHVAALNFEDQEQLAKLLINKQFGNELTDALCDAIGLKIKEYHNFIDEARK